MFFSLLVASTIWAAIPSKTSRPVMPQKVLSKSGSVSGGLAGSGFTIRDVTWVKLKKKERLVIDIADINGKSIRGFPGYYHAELQSNPNRLILDFSQTPNSRVVNSQVNKKLSKSDKVASSQMLLDPTDQTMSFILNLNKGTKAQVFQVKGKKGTSRVVVDLQ